MNRDSRIFIAGHRGMVGSAVLSKFKAEGYQNFLLRTHQELDLLDEARVSDFFTSNSPDIVIDAAARVGGILANRDFPYLFLMENLRIQNNLINGAFQSDVKKFIFLGSSCIYPKLAEQPLKEESLLTGPLEPTNESYAIAKIVGVKACEAIRQQYGLEYSSLMPTNLYGANDNFNLETSHVLPAMIRKFHEAKERNEPVTLWGSGTPRREFLHVNDLANAVFFAAERGLKDNLYNVGTGEDIEIRELARMIQQVVGHQGEIQWDSDKPDGTPRKLMDVSKMHKLGWKHEISLINGIKMTYAWYLANVESLKSINL